MQSFHFKKKKKEKDISQSCWSVFRRKYINCHQSYITTITFRTHLDQQNLIINTSYLLFSDCHSVIADQTKENPLDLHVVWQFQLMN